MAFAAGVHIGPYEILGLLGAGGMGEVYKAHDTRLRRVIALKTLLPEKIVHAERKERFLLEAQAASRLNHPNIVTIYDVLEENGVCFIAMEYVAGITLDLVCAGTGLPLKDAVRFGMEMADALAAAHSAGIIHRDLKPANIIITVDGRVKLLDFGLAKLTDATVPAAEAETAAGLTKTGQVVGTAAYMSPEQAEGRELDARSDIFSYGLILYEMLCGQRAFRGDSWISTLASILRDEPRPFPEIHAAIPEPLKQHVTRCLRKDPGQRFQSMLEVKLALEQASSAPGIVSSKASSSSSSRAAAAVVKQEEAVSIAVLPFANLSADRENEYFGDGLAEEIINELTKVPELRVIARTSAFTFRGQEQDLHAIAEKLKVGTILEGSVRRIGNHVRVTAQLIKVADESHLWSERYDREMTDIFAIQDDISQAIASALKVKLASPRRRTENIEAYQNYLKGLYWYQRYNPESLAKAKAAFERALELDPSYAPAYAGLAVFYYGLGALSIKRMIDMAPLAKSAAQRALEIDPMLSEAHSVLGLVVGAVEYDWKAAEKHFQAGMAIDPVPPLVRLRCGLYFLTPLRRYGEAMVQYQRALETDPLSMMAHFGLAFVLYCRRQYDQAIEHAARAVDLYPEYWLVHLAMGLALSQKGTPREAIVSLAKTVQLSPSFSLASGFLAAAYARSGDVGRAEKVIEEMRERSSRQYVSSTGFAVYHAALGQAEKVFEFLQAAFDDRDPYLTRIDAEPYFEPFRSDPRYRELMERLNLG
jgi:serine/threonine protein kinase/Tfp pilus assembly protein PilF